MSEPLQLGSGLRCGIVLSGQSRDQVIDNERRFEAAGFDSVWAGDHISFHIPLLESLTLLSFVAAATERIGLATGVYLVPLRHPTTSAKVISTLDVLSGGRLTLGVGVGGEFPPEFEAAGVPVKERGSRTDESIEIMRRLWSEDRVEHSGRHFRFGPVSGRSRPAERVEASSARARLAHHSARTHRCRSSPSLPTKSAQLQVRSVSTHKQPSAPINLYRRLRCPTLPPARLRGPG